MVVLRSPGGFTLLELIAVIFILAVSSAIVAVSLGRSTEKAKLRDETVRVRNLMAHGRDLALTERVPVTFFANPGDGSYGLEGRRTRLVGKGMEIEEYAEVVFFPKGHSTGGEVNLRGKDGRRYRVQVDPATGEASIGRL
jgi:prepilin-type N-terminal cleavage/methylation domain-containing protein